MILDKVSLGDVTVFDLEPCSRWRYQGQSAKTRWQLAHFTLHFTLNRFRSIVYV